MDDVLKNLNVRAKNDGGSKDFALNITRVLSWVTDFKEKQKQEQI